MVRYIYNFEHENRNRTWDKEFRIEERRWDVSCAIKFDKHRRLCNHKGIGPCSFNPSNFAFQNKTSKLGEKGEKPEIKITAASLSPILICETIESASLFKKHILSTSVIGNS